MANPPELNDRGLPRKDLEDHCEDFREITTCEETINFIIV